MVGEDSHFAHAEAALRKLQVSDFHHVPRSGMLEIEVAAQEEVRLGVVRGRGSKGLQGWGAIVRGGVQGSHGEP